ncbi:MAG: SIS domain-containing protein [Thermoplasmatota archaeon]
MLAQQSWFLSKLEAKSTLLKQGLAAGRQGAVSGLKPAGLLFAGMGGSGAAAMLVRDAAARHLSVPFSLLQEPALPRFVSRPWHVMAVSYSGETEETLAAVQAAQARGCDVTAFTTGGTLAGLAQRNVRQPDGYQPRMALAHTWFSILGFLEGSGLLEEKVPLVEAVAAVEAVDADCGPQVPEEKNEAKQLARRLCERIPQVFATPSFLGVGTFFASLMNENAKKIADIDVIPECNHNALTGWSGDPMRRHFSVLVLSHLGETAEMQRRIGFMQERYQSWDVPWVERTFGPIGGFRDHVIEQASALQLLDYVSYYTAVLRDVDPTQIDDVTALKARLRAGRASGGDGNASLPGAPSRPAPAGAQETTTPRLLRKGARHGPRAGTHSRATVQSHLTTMATVQPAVAIPARLAAASPAEAVANRSAPAQPKAGLDPEVAASLRGLEKSTGTRLGLGPHPLIVSVRRVAAPGEPSTALCHIGLTDRSVTQFARETGDPQLAYDAYRRLLADYGEFVMGVRPSSFSTLLASSRQALGLDDDALLPATESARLCAAYKVHIEAEAGRPFPQDAHQQLMEAITASLRRGAGHGPPDAPLHEGHPSVLVEEMIFPRKAR